ncbi:MAG: DUF6519 domain-containing protein [Novosphingobium sp.]
MRGDFTRDTRERARRTATRAVLLQQGRPLIDADINEQAQMVADRSEAIVRHVVGLRGVPRDDAGFAITQVAGGFTIGAGSLYAEGLPLLNPAAIAYDAQFPADILPSLASAIPDGQEAFVYVEAVLRPLIDPLQADPGLNGIDTAAREVAGWAVRVAPLSGIGMARADLIRALDRNETVDLVPWRWTTGGLDSQVDHSNSDPGPCDIAATSGYLDQLNRLYRVEIHQSGGPGAATYKWTEDASREAGLRAISTGFEIDLPLNRATEWFAPQTVVEVIDDARSRAGLSGLIGPITSAVGAPLEIGGVPASALGSKVRIRRWAAMPAVVPAAGAWAVLSKGVQVRFCSGDYAAGSAWTIPARTVLGDIVWPPYPGADKQETIGGTATDFYAPMEGRRYHAALALVRRNGTGFTVTEDLRDLFPPLTDITAGDVRFDDTASQLGADNVQQAIDILVQRGGDCCTWHARPSSNLQALVDSIPPRANGTLCLAVGNYELNAPLRIAGKGNIRVIGAGAGSKLWCRNGAQAVVVTDCLSIEFRDLLAAAEAPGAVAKLGHTGGAIDIADCGEVRVLRATLIAQGTRWRQSAALRIAGSPKPGGGDITVTDCDIIAGDLAGGILITDAQTLRIADNRIRPRVEPAARTLSRWSQDLAMAAAVGRLALSHAIDPKTRTRPATRIDTRIFADQTFSVGAVPLQAFVSNLVPAVAMRDLPALLARENPNGDSRSYRLRLRRLASTILVHAGRITVAGTAFTGWLGFYNTVRGLVAPAIDTAITVGGAMARDVAITGNRIEGALRGIRVGVNNGVAQARLPLGTIHIESNVIRLRVVPTDMARCGIYVGNSERTWIVDNDIASELADLAASDPRAAALRQQHFESLHAEGIRVFGTMGPMLQLRGNMVRDCNYPYTVTAAAGTDQRSKLWLVHGNYAGGGVTPYRLDDRCQKVNCV